MRWTALIALTLALAVTTWPATGQDDLRVELEVGEDTTFFTGPVRDNGTIDYIAALNAHYGEGIANEENAYVVLVQLFAEREPDWRGDSEDHWPRVFEVLGIDPPADRVRFIDWERFAADLGLDEREARDRYNAVLDGPWNEADHPEVKAWLEANNAAVALLREGLERELFFSPLASADDDRSLLGAINPQLGQCRDIARLLLIRFYHAIALDDVGLAVEMAWSIDRMGYHVTAEPTLIGKLVGLSCRSLASDAVRDLCEQGALRHEDALRLIQGRVQTHEMQSIQDVINHTDRCMALEQAQLLYLKLEAQRREFLRRHEGADFEVAALFEIDQSLRQLNGYYDRLLAIMRETDTQARQEAWDRFEHDIYDSYGESYLARAFITGLLHYVTGQGVPTRLLTEKITLKLAQTMLPAFGAAGRTEQRVDSRRDIDAVGLALLGYRDVHGELPESLDALVPTYFEQVPMDPYADGPLVYRVNEDGSALVYSVGEDLEDDGGVDDFREGDLVIRVGPPPAE